MQRRTRQGLRAVPSLRRSERSVEHILDATMFRVRRLPWWSALGALNLTWKDGPRVSGSIVCRLELEKLSMRRMVLMCRWSDSNLREVRAETT